MKKNKLYYFAAAIIVIIAFVVFLVIKNDGKGISIIGSNTENKVLLGDWLRSDSNYRIKINEVKDDGTLIAQYFNPNPINVGSAGWDQVDGDLKITVELRDANYPGSTYKLSYVKDKDILAGEYFQAVEGLTFYVEFTRIK